MTDEKKELPWYKIHKSSFERFDGHVSFYVSEGHNVETIGEFYTPLGCCCKTPERKSEFEQRFGDVGQRWDEFWSTRTFWRKPNTDYFDYGRWFASYFLKDCFDQVKIRPLVSSNRPLNFSFRFDPGDGWPVAPLLIGRKNRE